MIFFAQSDKSNALGLSCFCVMKTQFESENHLIMNVGF